MMMSLTKKKNGKWKILNILFSIGFILVLIFFFGVVVENVHYFESCIKNISGVNLYVLLSFSESSPKKDKLL